MSDWPKTERGCPQESNFGPLMWNIFQNDLTYNIQTDKCIVMMYVDLSTLLDDNNCSNSLFALLNLLFLIFL